MTGKLVLFPTPAARAVHAAALAKHQRSQDEARVLEHTEATLADMLNVADMVASSECLLKLADQFLAASDRAHAIVAARNTKGGTNVP